jgi:hypothetical protein
LQLSLIAACRGYGGLSRLLLLANAATTAKHDAAAVPWRSGLASTAASNASAAACGCPALLAILFIICWLAAAPAAALLVRDNDAG